MSGKQLQAETSPQVMAISYVRHAEAYRISALRVCPEETPSSDVALIIPAWHLLCHSSELALKAYLLSGGADPSGKKGGLKHTSLRHNLIGLYDLAVDRGFTAPDGEFGGLMAGLAPFHTDHVFRYLKTGCISLATPRHIGTVLEPIILNIAKTAGARWRATRGPGQDDEDLASVGLARAQPEATDTPSDGDHTLRKPQ